MKELQVHIGRRNQTVEANLTGFLLGGGGGGAVNSVNGKTGAVVLTAEDVGALPNTTKVPTKTSELTNDSGFITKAVNDLVNYYAKQETYSREEIDNKISAIPKFSIEVVDSLPTTDISETTVYLVPSGEEEDNLYTEYIYVNGAWEYLGKQTVDLTGYVKRTELSSYYTKTDMDALIESVRSSIPTKLSQLTADATHRTVTDTEKQTWNNKSNFSGAFKDLTGKPTTLSGYGITDGATKEEVGRLQKTIVDQQTEIDDVKNDVTALTEELTGITLEKEVVVNYFDKTKIKENKSINSNGSLVSVSGTYASTEIIPFPTLNVGDTFVFVCNGRTIDYNTDGVKYVFYDENNAIVNAKTGIAGYGCPAFYMDETRATQIKGYALEFTVSKTGAVAYDYTYIHNVVDNLMLIRLNDGVGIFNEYVPYLEVATIYQNPFKKVDNRNKYDDKFYCVAYSEGYGDYPANTVESYEIASRLDFDMIKGDVRITSDGVLVMCHDPAYTLDGNGRISSVYSSSSTTNVTIRNKTFAEIRALEYAKKPSNVANYVHPATLEELIVICKKYGKTPFITIRDEYIDEVIPAMFEILEKHDMTSCSIVNTLTWNTIVEVRKMNEEVMISHPQRADTEVGLNVNDMYGMVMLLDSLGNCIYGVYCSIGASTTDAEIVANLQKAFPAVELAKSIDIRTWGCIVGSMSQMERLVEYGLTGAMTDKTYTETNKREVVSASISNGVISFKNILGDEQFNVTLPIYNGGVS